MKWIVKKLPGIIVSGGGRLGSRGDVLGCLAAGEGSMVSMLVWGALFVSGLGDFVSLFCFWSSAWLCYDGLGWWAFHLGRENGRLSCLQLVRQLVYTMFTSNNRASFHLW